MKVTYDKVADAMYIYFAPGKKSSRTEQIGEGLLVDYAGRELIGIEILDVSTRLPSKKLTPEFSIPVDQGRITRSV